MEKNLIKNILNELLENKHTIDETANILELEHLKAMRPFCVSLAEVGLGIIKDAQDTVWVTDYETAIDRIFNELGIDLVGSPKEELEKFINYEVKTWHAKRSVKKTEQPVQLELNLES